MHNETKDIRPTETTDQPTVNATYGELMQDIRALVMAEKYLPPIEDGDYTVRDAMKDTGLSENPARAHLDKLVAAGVLRVVKKRGKTGNPVATYAMA